VTGLRLRTLIAAAATVTLFFQSGSAAVAATGPVHLQRLAAEQTKLLFSHYHGSPQVASPATCSYGDEADEARPFLLPTLSFGAGNAGFSCHLETRTALLDLGGFTVTEDNTGDTYPLPNGENVPFTRANLERICDDALLRLVPAPAPATLDGKPIVGTPVSTSVFEVKVLRSAAFFWQQSVAVGHPGRLAATFCGWKALVPLAPGPHVIKVDLSGITGSPTHFTYRLLVEHDQDE
jgi:hypothetical protein